MLFKMNSNEIIKQIYGFIDFLFKNKSYSNELVPLAEFLQPRSHTQIYTFSPYYEPSTKADF